MTHWRCGLRGLFSANWRYTAGCVGRPISLSGAQGDDFYKREFGTERRIWRGNIKEASRIAPLYSMRVNIIDVVTSYN
jgi:hypothetical protein